MLQKKNWQGREKAKSIILFMFDDNFQWNLLTRVSPVVSLEPWKTVPTTYNFPGHIKNNTFFRSRHLPHLRDI